MQYPVWVLAHGGEAEDREPTAADAMTQILDMFSEVLRTLWAHKLRSFLTMFGIAWGVGSLLLLIGLGEGFRSGQRRNLETLGRDIIFLFPGRIPAVPGQGQGLAPYFLTYQDYLDIRREATKVRNAAPVLQRGDIRALSEFASSNGQVTGSTPNFSEIRYLPQGEGRWLNQQDEAQRRNVVVLGYEMRRNLFPGRPAVGSSILLNGIRFEVVGVLANIGRQENNPDNLRIYMPWSTMRLHFPLQTAPTRDAVSFINLQPTQREEHDAALEQIRRIIARNHKFDYRNQDAFQVWDTIKSQEMIGKIFDAMDLFLGAVGMVTLMLGAIGIVNIMLVAVSERTYEIGLRKALGATQRSILMQFFAEGALLTLLSGGIGIAAAWGFMAVLARLIVLPFFDPPHVVPFSAALALGSLTMAAVAASLYPARKAAILTPVEALRRE
jgi:putative ABC transport system permease protein